MLLQHMLMIVNIIFCKYAEDFTLFELGSWDDSNCIFDLLKTPYSLGVLIEFRKDDPSGQISRIK